MADSKNELRNVVGGVTEVLRGFRHNSVLLLSAGVVCSLIFESIGSPGSKPDANIGARLLLYPIAFAPISLVWARIFGESRPEYGFGSSVGGVMLSLFLFMAMVILFCGVYLVFGLPIALAYARSDTQG